MDSKPWLKSYPVGVPVHIDTDHYKSLVDFIIECLTTYADRPAFECMGVRLSYKQLDSYSDALAAYLHSRGLNPGDRIAIMMPNCLQYPIATFAALKAGLIIVNTNPLYTPREMEHQFTDSGVSAIIIIENFASNLETVLAKTNIKTIITTTIGEMLGVIKGSVVNFVVKYVKRMVPQFELPNTVSFGNALAEGKKFTIRPFENNPDTVIVHQYTGGTTGVAKGAMLTNRNLIANMIQIRVWLQKDIKDLSSLTTLSPLPMYHIFAFTVNCLAMISYGAHTVLVTNAKDIPSVIGEFKKNKIVLMTGLNTLFNAMLNNASFKDQDFSSLKITVGGGMAIQKAVADRWYELTGCRLTEGFGMTESSPLITVNPLDGSGRQGSIGLPVSSTDVRIVGEDGQVLGIDEVGEIQAKGPQVMKGYYNQPSETAKTITADGWLCTGDIGKMDSDGYCYIVDRKKDMILVSGFNVYPNEIENVIMLNSKVLEVAAVGMPDEKSGEVVKVHIVKKDASLTREEIIEHCRANLTGYKVPREVVWADSLPKTNVGKILRRELR
jgi:long-chain acyl-CoA synthetase